MKYCLDENLSQVSARLARDDGVDAISSHEIGMDGRSDIEQVRFATREERVLMTRDYGDMGRALDELVSQGEAYAGVLFVSGRFDSTIFADVALALADWEQAHPEGVPPGFVG